MKVITVLTDLDDWGFRNYLKRSCEVHSLELVVLQHSGVFFSNRIKDALLYEYIGTLPDSEIIFFTDGTDTAFLSQEKEILMKFCTYNSPLVFSCEKNCWPDSNLSSMYPDKGRDRKYLNSGAFIGNVGFLKYLYRKYPIWQFAADDYRWSNQYLWNNIYINEYSTIKLDLLGEMFYNTSTTIQDRRSFQMDLQSHHRRKDLFNSEIRRLDSEIFLSKNRILNKTTNTFPCHIHFPGPISKMILKSGYFNEILQDGGNNKKKR